MQFKNDKRSLKTRRAIKIAFLKLLKTNDIAEVNITEITKIAGINRNSFYTHYKSVNNILDDINNEIYTYMEETLEKYSYLKVSVDPYPIISDFSKIIVNTNYITQYLLFSKSSTELARKLKDSICDRFYNSYVKEVPNGNPYIRYYIAFIISGVFDMYYVWFRNNKDVSLDELSRKISRFILMGLPAIE